MVSTAVVRYLPGIFIYKAEAGEPRRSFWKRWNKYMYLYEASTICLKRIVRIYQVLKCVFFTSSRSFYPSTYQHTPCPCWFFIFERCKLCGHKSTTHTFRDVLTVCVFHIKPLFLLVDIQHTQCPHVFFILERYNVYGHKTTTQAATLHQADSAMPCHFAGLWQAQHTHTS